MALNINKENKMFVMTNQYDEGRIYEVVNPDDCPLRSGSAAIICDGIDGVATIGGYSVEVRRAKNLPRDWRHVQPGLFGGGECRWDLENEVFIRILNDDSDK